MTSNAPPPARKHRRLQIGLAIVFIAVVAICGWLAVYASMANRSISVAVVFRLKREDPALFGRGPVNIEEFRRFKRDEVLAINSVMVVAAALNRPNIAQLGIIRRQKDAVAWLKNELEIDSAEDSEIVFLRIRGRNATEMRQILNSVATSYLAYREHSFQRELRDTLVFLEDTIMVRNAQIEQCQQQIEHTKVTVELEKLRQDLQVFLDLRKESVRQRELVKMKMRSQENRVLALELAYVEPK